MPVLTGVWASAFISACVATALYSNAFGCEFAWDDRPAILTNADVTGATPWSALLQHDFWGQDISLKCVCARAVTSLSVTWLYFRCSSSHKSFRPITVGSFRLNAAVGGIDPWGYHAVNVALHIAATVLVVLFTDRVVDSAAALTAGAVFAAHPVHVEAVTSVVGRADVLSTVFALCALLVYDHVRLQGGQWSRRDVAAMFATVALVTAATLSKEVGITILPALVLYDVLLRRGEGGRRECTRARSWRAAVLVAFGAAFMSFRLSVHRGAPLYEWTVMENQYALMPPSVERTLSVLHTHVMYVALLVWPSRLCFDHGLAESTPLSGWTDIRVATVVALYVAAGVSVVALFRRRHATALWGVLCATSSFAPASNLFVFVGTEVAERLLYLPSVGLVVALAALFPARVAQGKPTKTARVLAVAVLLLGVRTLVRNEDWRKEGDLYEAGIRDCPMSVKALNNRAQTLMLGDVHDRERSDELLQRAISIYPDYGCAWYNRGLVRRNGGNATEALPFLLRAQALGDTKCSLYVFLGEACHSAYRHGFIRVETADGVIEDTLACAKKSLERAADGCESPFLYFERGSVALELGMPEAAWTEFQEAERRALQGGQHNPPVELWSVYNMMGVTMRARGKNLESLQYFEKALTLNPGEIDAISNAAGAYTDSGNHERAFALHNRALELAPSNGIVVNNAGWAAEVAGHLLTAREFYTRALQLLPGHQQLETNLRNLNVRIAAATGQAAHNSEPQGSMGTGTAGVGSPGGQDGVNDPA